MQGNNELDPVPQRSPTTQLIEGLERLNDSPTKAVLERLGASTTSSIIDPPANGDEEDEFSFFSSGGHTNFKNANLDNMDVDDWPTSSGDNNISSNLAFFKEPPRSSTPKPGENNGDPDEANTSIGEDDDDAELKAVLERLRND